VVGRCPPKLEIETDPAGAIKSLIPIDSYQINLVVDVNVNVN